MLTFIKAAGDETIFGIKDYRDSLEVLNLVVSSQPLQLDYHESLKIYSTGK